MPPSVNRLLLTSLHSLLIVAILSSSLAPLAVVAAPTSALVARAVTQDAPPAENTPEPVSTDVPELRLEPEEWMGPLSNGGTYTIPVATPRQPVMAQPLATPPVIEIPALEASSDNIAPLPQIPLDVIVGEGVELMPSSEPVGVPDLPAVPVSLNLELDRYLLLPGEQATLRVDIRLIEESFGDSVQMTLALPPQLQIVGDPESNKIWTYSAETLAAGIHQTFAIAVHDTFTGSDPAVVEMRLEVAAAGHHTWNERLVVGILGDTLPVGDKIQALQSPNGSVLHAPGLTVLAPVDAAPAGVQIEYTPLFTATLPLTTTVPVTTSLPTTTSVPFSATSSLTETLSVSPTMGQQPPQVFLPVLSQDTTGATSQATSLVAEPEEAEPTTSALVPQVDNGLTAYRIWHLSVNGLDSTAPNATSEAAHPQFDHPVLMVVDVADLATQGVNMDLLTLWTRPDESQDWRPVPFARYDQEQQSWVVWLDHFSDFALGIAPAANGELLPSITGHRMDYQTGAATFSYPINSPSGLGGLNPNFSLNYSGQVINDIFLAVGNDSNDDIQASMMGYGWSLGGMNSITKFRDSEDEVYYSLTLNGQSYDIHVIEVENQPDQYETDPISFAAIKFTESGATSQWEIKTPDGTLYEFGGTVPFTGTFSSVNDMQWAENITETTTTHLDMRFNVENGLVSREVTAWHLNRVEDTAGNAITYTVTSERGEVTEDSCLAPGIDEEDPDDDDLRWYTKAVRLSEAWYSGNTGKYDDNESPSNPTLRVRFAYDSRADTAVEVDCQTRVTENRLSQIYIESRKTDDSGWNTIRHYDLVPDYADPSQDPIGGFLRHLLLQNIHEYGKSGTTVLNTHTFSYTAMLDSELEDTEYNIHMLYADNGYEARITYAYTSTRVNCPDENVCQENRIRLVAEKQVEDGQGNYYITTFDYHQPHLRVEAGRMVYMGTDWTSSTIYEVTTDPNGTLAVARYEEYTFERGTRNDPHASQGKLKTMIVRDHNGSGNIIYSKVTNTWASFTRNDNDDGWQSTEDNGTKPIWTRLERKEEWTGNALGGYGRQEKYLYDDSSYVNTYGNVIEVGEYSHANTVASLSLNSWEALIGSGLTLHRSTITEYYPNTGWLTDADDPYIVNLPARVIVRDGDNNCQAETRTIYASDLIQDLQVSTQGRAGAYDNPPATAYAIKTEQVISGCPYNDLSADNRENSDFLVTSLARDEYGNETIRTSHNGGSGQNISIYTNYDDFYNLFPIGRYNGADPSLVARAKYYGVDSVSVDANYGVWGATSETCEMNNICTRFGYDEFGRKTHQWDRQLYSSSWPTEAVANVVWAYRKPGEINPAQKSYIVTEWHSPRCEGNWTRHHYDGLGRLVAEQKSHHDYHFTSANCLPGETGTLTGHEIVTSFYYKALGLWVEYGPYVRQSNGGDGYLYYAPGRPTSVIATRGYDPLGREIGRVSRNRDYIYTVYSGRALIVYSTRTGAVFKRIRSQQFDALGNLLYLKNEKWNGVGYTLESQLTLSHDVLGNLRSVTYPSSLGTSTYTYDQAGRMTSMDDVDMGNWIYTYNRHGQRTQLRDARNYSTCFYYDAYARLEAKHYADFGVSCPSTSSTYHEKWTYGTNGAEVGHVTDIQIRRVTDNLSIYTKTLTYNDFAQVISETVIHGKWWPTVIGYGYDDFGRIEKLYYPDDTEELTYGYNGMGLQEAMTSTIEGIIVNAVGYDELGRMNSMRLPGITNTLYVTHTPYIWNAISPNSNARLRDIAVGTEGGTYADTLLLDYSYDMYGNIAAMGERYNGVGTVMTHTFEYDAYNRLEDANYISPAAVTHSYEYSATSQPKTYAGLRYGYNADRVFAVRRATRLSDNAQLVYTYDANGNMSQRQYFDANGVKQTQTLGWHRSNQYKLGSVYWNGPNSPTFYEYDADGVRTRIQQGTVGNLIGYIYPSPYLEFEWVQATNTVTPTRYYMLNGQPIALKIGNQPVTHLHRDHLGSVVMTTQDGVVTSSRQYYAFGNKRGGDEYPFEPNYTGQRLDDTGLLYYNARYYDPQLGMFISPDSMIPDPGDYFSYNRYLYSRGNPVSNNDPTGHCTASVVSGPLGLAIDIPCWGGAGTAAAAALATTLGLVVGTEAVIFVLNEPQLNYPPPFPANEEGQIVESFPLPDSNTLTSGVEGIPLIHEEPAGIQGIQPADPTGLLILQSSRDLDRNMQAAGITRPPNTAAHHIVPEHAQRAALARAILAGAGIDVNDASNGVYLPENLASPNPTGAAVHSGIHTGEYYNEVEQRLLNAGPGGVPGVLQQIGQELLNNTFPYR